MPSGFFALLDDISYLLDDVATAAKITTKKTAVILGDDLAVGAKKTLGVSSSREIPIIIAIIKGSLLNKLIILPLIFLLKYFIPWIISPLLIIGGTYLSFEGVENVIDFLKHKEKKSAPKSEKEKIKSAILTDFILSLEIVIISLASVQDKPFLVQVASTTVAALFATAGVYGTVALIIRMDDIGLFLVEKFDGFLEKFGMFLIKLLPKTIKFLSVIGTAAMILVGGGIYLHRIPLFHNLTMINIPLVSELLLGLTAGFFIFFLISMIKHSIK
ncbi:DUF808 family protein [Hippea alviniae]|uniref:DUF808 family protein n=1 Tax=Hippea alviniae TaxID=1279027 RepID=UPI0003B520AF|nr:DUF808 family protein [Hippea alviniae]